jgi:hypothetical protein
LKWIVYRKCHGCCPWSADRIAVGIAVGIAVRIAGPTAINRLPLGREGIIGVAK